MGIVYAKEQTYYVGDHSVGWYAFKRAKKGNDYNWSVMRPQKRGSPTIFQCGKHWADR